jgi:hypothetical protein
MPSGLTINPADLANLVVAARIALRQLAGADLVNVSNSIAAIEALLAQNQKKPGSADPDKP